MQAFAEINEKGDRIAVYFRWDPVLKDRVKAVPGARFVPREKGGPYWQLPLDLLSARLLREAVGPELKLGNALKQWGREAIKKDQTLRALSLVDDVPVEELKINEKLPELAKWLRPYQRADVKFLATTNALNLNEPRLGKTVETIGAIYEADLENGPHLVVAPQSSLETIWRMEIERWTDGRVFTYSGESKDSMGDFYAEVIRKKMKPAWWVTTAAMIRAGQFPQLEYGWNSITIDEYHKTGLAETKNVFPKAINKVEAKRKYAMSGTPMGGKVIKLWGGLHFIEPQQYTSKWRYAGQWFKIEDGYQNHKKIGGIKEGLEDAFYQSLAPHAVRRLREEVLPQLPPKQQIDVWCGMTPKQRKQYETFAADAEIRIDEYHLSATGILAEYTRLKQFANSYCEVEEIGWDDAMDKPKLKVRATPESGKLPHLMERLAEIGIDPDELAGTSQAIVASQFKETADMVFDHLTEKGIPCVKLTGDTTKKGERARIQRAFQEGNESGLRVVVMTTTAGGVAITLDNVESVHVLDETWNPDDQEQLTDRAINTTRLHQVTVFTYRSLDTIEHMIHGVNIDKAFTNKDVLDLRRQAYKQHLKDELEVA